MRTIGILGGMGPEATAKFYSMLISIFQAEFGAVYDSDFPQMIILNLPLPDVVEDATKRRQAEEMLVEGARKLEAAGADFIAIPCNTVMLFLPAMQRAVSLPFINIVEETATRVKDSATVGVLGTEMTIEQNLYGKYFPKNKIIVPSKKEQQVITKVIVNILAGQKLTDDRKILRKYIQSLKQRGAEKVILGCTELPLLVQNERKTIDTIKVFAEAVVKRAIDI